jgi:hypothetical protein
LPRSNRIYAFGSECFVASPLAAGIWVRTHICVALVDCPQCNAPRGQLCVNTDSEKPHSYTHHRRRTAAKNTKLPPVVISGAVIYEGPT